MDKSKIKAIVVLCVDEYLETQDIDVKVNDDLVLIGNEALLDSMGLVNIVVDIESKLLDEDIEISLTSEKAMSMKNSPFRTVSTLVDFIEEQIGENHA